MLITARAHVNWQKGGEPPIVRAVLTGDHVDTCRVLLSAGADLGDVQDDHFGLPNPSGKSACWQ
jgi:hypothetical protein